MEHENLKITLTEPTSFALRMLKNGAPCPFIPLDGKIATRCLGLGLIEGELRQARSLLEMIDSDMQTQGLALWHAAVAGYGRCFVSAEGRKTKLERVHLKDLPIESQKAHEYIMQVRHQRVAHAGNSPDGSAAVNRMFLQLMPETGERAIDNFRYFTAHSKVPHESHLKNAISLISALVTLTLELRIRSENKLMQTYNTLEINELYQNACSSDLKDGKEIVIHCDD